MAAFQTEDTGLGGAIPPRPRKLPMLEAIDVAAPCAVPWAAMDGDDRVRFCSECRLNVYDLSDMSREEAQAFVAGAEGRVCVTFYRRADGTVLTADCPVGLALRRRARRMLGVLVGAVVLLLASLFGVAGVRFDRWFDSSRPERVTGKIAPPTTNPDCDPETETAPRPPPPSDPSTRRTP